MGRVVNDYVEGDWVYDLETYPNVFTFGIVKADGSKLHVFEVSDRKNDTEAIMNCLRWLDNNKQRMIGFNNIGFDYPIIHQIIENAIKARRCGMKYELSAREIYNMAQAQINSFRGSGFGNTVKTEEERIRQVDLYKIHHFDNKAKSTSLKMLEFNMRSENIEDLPFEVGKILTNDEIDVLINYNKSDVMRTLDFYYETLDAIKFRAELSSKMGIDTTNFNDTKIGKEYFIQQLEKYMPGSCYKKTAHKRVVQQSKRKFIDIGDCLLDYYDFHRPEFQAVLDWFNKQRITETKGVFSDIEEHDLDNVANYTTFKTKGKKFQQEPTQQEIVEFREEHPLGWIETKDLKSPKGAKAYWKRWNIAENLHVNIDGFRFDFGTGGLHGSLSNTIVRSDDEYIIIDYDVASYYPNLAIANRAYPEHLSERFCDIYEDVYQQRKGHAKGTAENALLKLALNGVYGDSNNQYSPFYDPKYTMTITINGQLSLCLLVDRLLEIDGLSMVQANTDGITIKCPRKYDEEADHIVAQWEMLTGLEMERADYSAMYLRDVNNYIAVYTDGKTKRKGAYEYEGLGWHQNQSALVIPMAAEAAMVHGKDVEEFIRGHKNKYDFMLRTKVPRSSRLVMVNGEGEDVPQQNICRYYPSTDGGKLIKIMPPLPGKEEAGERRLSIDKDWLVKTCNNIDDFDWDIDYEYYITNAKKLIINETSDE